MSHIRKQMIAGGTAGMIADAVTYPLMTVKSRLQVQGSFSPSNKALHGAKSFNSYAYNGTLNAILTISKREGWKTLYKGFPTVIQVAPAQALYMGFYQVSKKLMPWKEDSVTTEFFGGIFATLGQSLLMVPLEVVRQRQQIQTKATIGAYTGALDAARKIYQVEGIASFYRGFGMTQVVWIPFNAVYLPIWESLKRFSVAFSGVDSPKELQIQYELGSSLVSSAFAAAVTNPMDVVKTRLQVQGRSNVASSTGYTNAWDAFKSIVRNEGLKGLSQGMSSRVLWVAPSSMIMFTTYDLIIKVFA